MRIKIVLLGVLSLLTPNTLFSQAEESLTDEFLKSNVQKIESIDPDFSLTQDLEFLKKELQGVEIVMLGEQSHGDGSTFEAKTRLIRYLHEEMGFNVLVFESGLMDMYRVWKKIEEGADSLAVFNYGIFPVWAVSMQVEGLFRYILEESAKDQPLVIAGFDMQPTGALMSPAERWEELKAYLMKTIDFNEDAYPAFSKLFMDLSSVFRNPLSDQDVESMENEFSNIRRKILDSDYSLEGRIYAQYIDNYFKTITLYTRADLSNPAKTPQVFNIRDMEMAENFQLLRNIIYPGEKFIVWGANSHLGYGRGLLGNFEDVEPAAPAMVPMGQYLKTDYQDKLYTLAFTSYEGSVGSLRGTISKLPAGHELSLEKKLADLDYPYSFLSLRHEEIQTLRFPSRIYGHEEMSGVWAQMADGIFFIRTMKPSENLQ